MPKPRWSDDEHALLDTYYPRYGAEKTSSIMARKGYTRTPKSIACKADSRLLFRSAGKDLVPLCWVAPVTQGTAYYATIENAKAAGVLKVAPGNPKYWIPTWYADQLVKQDHKAPEYGPLQYRTLAILRKRGPTMTRTIAKELGVPLTRIASSLRRLEDRGVVARFAAHARHASPPSVWAVREAA